MVKKVKMIFGANKKPITSVLRKMKVGDVHKWGIERFDSVRAIAGKVAKEKRSDGWVLQLETTQKMVRITRIA